MKKNMFSLIKIVIINHKSHKSRVALFHVMDIGNAILPAHNWRIVITTNNVVRSIAVSCQCVSRGADPFKDCVDISTLTADTSDDEDDNAAIAPINDEDDDKNDEGMLDMWEKYAVDRLHDVCFVFVTNVASGAGFSYSPLQTHVVKIRLEFCANDGMLVTIFETELSNIHIDNVGGGVHVGKVAVSLPWCDDILLKLHFTQVRSEVAYMLSDSIEMSMPLKTLAFLVLFATNNVRKHVRY